MHLCNIIKNNDFKIFFLEFWKNTKKVYFTVFITVFQKSSVSHSRRQELMVTREASVLSANFPPRLVQVTD